MGTGKDFEPAYPVREEAVGATRVYPAWWNILKNCYKFKIIGLKTK